MAVHPVQWTICRWDRRIEAVVRVNDADHDGEAVHCANAGKVQTDADGEIPGRVKGRKCTGFVHVDHGDTSELIVLNDLLRTDVKRSNVTHPAGRPRVHSASQGCGRITRITWTTRPNNNECLPSSPIRRTRHLSPASPSHLHRFYDAVRWRVHRSRLSQRIVAGLPDCCAELPRACARIRAA